MLYQRIELYRYHYQPKVRNVPLKILLFMLNESTNGLFLCTYTLRYLSHMG